MKLMHTYNMICSKNALNFFIHYIYELAFKFNRVNAIEYRF